MTDTDIIARLQALREQAGLSQEEIAEAIGVSGRSAVSKIERGDRKLTIQEAMAWAQACGATLELIPPEHATLLRRVRALEPERLETTHTWLEVAAESPELTWRILEVQVETLVVELGLRPSVKKMSPK